MPISPAATLYIMTGRRTNAAADFHGLRDAAETFTHTLKKKTGLHVPQAADKIISPSQQA